MEPRPFIGVPRGGIETQVESDTTRRKIPLAIACTAAGVCNAITLCIYAVKWAGLAQGWWNGYTPNAWIGPVRAWFRRVDAVWTGTCAWVGPQFFLRLRPLFIEWMVCLGILVIFEQLPRLLIADGLVPFSQYNPNDGLRTTWGMLFHRPRIEEEPVQEVEQGSLVIHDKIIKNRSRPQHRWTEISTPKAGREALARWFWRICRQDGVGFSQNVAQTYGIQRRECKKVQRVFEHRGWAVDRGGTQGYDLVGTNDDPLEGLHIMWDVVTEFFPDAHPPQERT
jgi:hypothetical protein